MRQYVKTGCLICANENLAARRSIQLRNGQLGFIVQPEQPLRITEKQFPGLREADLLADPIEKLFAKLFFEHSNLRANGRLCSEELLCRQREAPVDSNFVKISDLIQVHKISKTSKIKIPYR